MPRRPPPGLSAVPSAGRITARIRPWPFVYLGIALLMTARAWENPTESWVGGLPDPGQSIWFLEWMPHAALHPSSPLYTHLINQPAGVNLTWQTWHPLVAVVVAPVTVLFGGTVAYNLAMTLAIATTFIGCHVALGRWVQRTGARIAGSLLFGLSPFAMISDHSHLNFAFLGLCPLLVALIDDIWTARGAARRTGLCVGLLITVQYFLAIELAAMDVVIAAVVTATFAIVRGLDRSRLRHLLRTSLWAVPLPLLLAGPFVAYQFLGPAPLTSAPQPDNVFMVDLLNFIVPTSATLLAPQQATEIAQHFSGNLAEWTGYVGVLVGVAFVVTAVRRRGDPFVRSAALLAVIVGVLSMGTSLHVNGTDTHIPLPWWIFDRVPIVREILPDRFAAFTFLFIAIVVAAGLEDLVKKRRGSLALVVATLCVASVMSEVPLIATSPVTPPFFSRTELRTDANVLIAPFPRAENADAMYWQARSGLSFPIVGGYYIGDPCAVCSNAIVEDLIAIENGETRRVPVPAEARQRLIDDRVGVVVVGPMANESQAVAFCTITFGPPSETRDGVTVWFLGST